MACRYNVRETGFVDLGMDPYVLCLYINKETGADIVNSFKEVTVSANEVKCRLAGNDECLYKIDYEITGQP